MRRPSLPKVHEGLAKRPRLAVVLDPDDPRPPYRQVANHLRASILTGEFKPGDQLPTGGQLSEMYGVARMTVQKAIQILRKEDLIVSRQGSGVFVKGRVSAATGLRSHVEAGFESPEVTIDFFGHNSESLRGALSEPLEKVRRGRYTPDLVRIRAIVPNTETPWALPCRAADRADLPALRKMVRSKIDRHLLTIVDAVHDLEELGLVPSAAAEVRTIVPVQLIELCLINERELFLGLCPVGERTIELDGTEQRVIDLLTGDTAMLHHRRPDEAAAGDELADSGAGRDALAWFESVWDTLAEPLR
jgi:DNA-binding transcriptional regulator YhcF (GntR family)